MILDSSGNPIERPEPILSRRKLRRAGLVLCALAAGLALLLGNLQAIFATASSWIPGDAKSRPGFEGIVESIADVDLSINFPVIRVSEKCYYEICQLSERGYVEVGPFTLDGVRRAQMFQTAGFGGELKESYPLGFAATPQIRGQQAIFSPPIFELVLRNDGKHAVVISKVGFRVNVKAVKPMAGPFQEVGTRIPFDEVIVDADGAGFGDVRTKHVDPVVLAPGAVHGFRVLLDGYENVLIQVIQLVAEADGVLVKTPEIYMHF